MYRFRLPAILAVAVLVVVLGVGGFLLRDTLNETFTGECRGGDAVVAVDATPSLAAVPDLRDDQIAASVEAALEACDEVHAVRFGATVKEIDLADASVKVPGKTEEGRAENRPAVAAELLDRITADVDAAAPEATASDIVAALDFIATTYLDRADHVTVTVITDGFFSRAGAGTIDASTAERAAANLEQAGVGDIDLSGATITLAGVGAAQEDVAYAREQIDILQQVWTQALDSADSVDVVEALPDSSGMATRLRAAERAEGETAGDEQEGATMPLPSSGVGVALSAAAVPFVRRRRNGKLGSAWVPVAPDTEVSTALDNAADMTSGSAETFAHEARAIDGLDVLQAQLEDDLRARASRGLIRRLIRHQILATQQRQAFVAALSDAGCRHVDEEAAVVVAAGRTRRPLSRPAANVLEGMLIAFDVWAVGAALATGTDSSLGDGLLLAMGGAVGAVMIGRVIGAEVAHLDALHLIPEDDPARRYWSGTFTTAEVRPAHHVMLGVAGGGLLLLALAMGLVRSNGAGPATTLLVTLLPLFTMVGTMAIERLTANPLADQVDLARRDREQAERRVAAVARRSRSLVKARQMAALLSLLSTRVDARKAARTAIADATKSTRAGAVGVPVPESAVEARAELTSPFVEEKRIPSSVARVHQLNAGHVEAIDSAAALEAQAKIDDHAATTRARLVAAGVELETHPSSPADAPTDRADAEPSAPTDDSDRLIDLATVPYDAGADPDGAASLSAPRPNGMSV